MLSSDESANAQVMVLSWLTPKHHSGFYVAYPLTKIHGLQ